MKKLIFVTLGIICLLSNQSFAGEKTPWLKGVKIGPIPKDLSPVLPLKIYAADGNKLPATFTEDVPVIVMAETKIFDNDPPAKYKEVEIPNPEWVEKTAVSWFFIDWEKNKNSVASTTQMLALNQMVVTPLNPTGKGAVTCHLARKMRYDLPEPGRKKATYVNSSGAKDVRVLDITPPTCGLEIIVEETGKSGAFWPVENPPNKYPLPKMADVILEGPLFGVDPGGESKVVSQLELGKNMIVTPDQAALHCKANDVLNFKLLGEDNYKLDDSKLKFGICAGAGGEPSPIGPENPDRLELSKINIPENPYIYIDARDLAGNREVCFIPLKIH